MATLAVRINGYFDTNNIMQFRDQMNYLKAGSILSVVMDKGGIPAQFSYIAREPVRGRAGTTIYHLRSTTGQILAVNWKTELPYSIQLIQRGTEEAVVKNPNKVRRNKDEVTLRVDNDGLKDWITAEITGPLTGVANVCLETLGNTQELLSMIRELHHQAFPRRRAAADRETTMEALRRFAGRGAGRLRSLALEDEQVAACGPAAPKKGK